MIDNCEYEELCGWMSTLEILKILFYGISWISPLSPSPNGPHLIQSSWCSLSPGFPYTHCFYFFVSSTVSFPTDERFPPGVVGGSPSTFWMSRRVVNVVVPPQIRVVTVGFVVVFQRRKFFCEEIFLHKKTRSSRFETFLFLEFFPSRKDQWITHRHIHLSGTTRSVWFDTLHTSTNSHDVTSCS